MKKTIGIITLLVMSQSLFAEEMAAKPLEEKQTETNFN